MEKNSLPIFSGELAIADKGLRLVNDITSDALGWIFRNQPEKDLGIDAFIEVVNESNQGTGRLIAAQIKCGTSYFDETTEDGYIYRGTSAHLNYWLNYSVPVILVICNPESGCCFWTEISKANVIVNKKGWRVLVSYTNAFDISCKEHLADIAGRPRHSDIASLLLYHFLYERYGSSLEICPVVDLPRDFHGSSVLAELNRTLVIIDYLYDDAGRITTSQVNELLSQFEYNKRVVSGCTKLMLFIISPSIASLNLDSNTMHLLTNRPDIQYFRLHYAQRPEYGLSDIDETNEKMFEYLELRSNSRANNMLRTDQVAKERK